MFEFIGENCMLLFLGPNGDENLDVGYMERIFCEINRENKSITIELEHKLKRQKDTK